MDAAIEIGGLFNEAILDQAALEAGLGKLAAFSNADGAHLVVTERREPSMLFGALVGGNPDAHLDYAQNYIESDPRVSSLLAAPGGKTFVDQELVTPDVYEAHPVFRDFQIRWGSQNSIQATLPTADTHAGVIAFARHHRKEEFHANDRRKIEALLPIVAEPIATLTHLRSSLSDPRVDEECWIAIGSKSNVVNIYELYGRCKLFWSAFFAFPRFELRYWKENIACGYRVNRFLFSSGPSRPRRITVLLKTPPLRVVLEEIPSVEARPLPKFGGKYIRVLIGICETAVRFQNHYRLTPRELDLVHALANGETIRSFAVALDRSEETLRTHLKSIFRKTGSSNQAELIRKYLLLVCD